MIHSVLKNYFFKGLGEKSLFLRHLIKVHFMQKFKMEKNSNIEKVLMAYVNGQANADELKKLLEWLDQSPDNKKHLEVIKEFWESSQYKVSVEGQDEAFQKIQEKIYADKLDTPNIRRMVDNRISDQSSFRWIKGLAAAFLVLTMIVSFYFIRTADKQDILVEEVPAFIKSETRPGQKSKITLGDGTIVWLNSESAIEYPKKFNGPERLVKLDGEAFFEVAKDELKPFKVTCDNITTTALGTSFNVQYFKEDEELTISLITGKVMVALDNLDPYFLDPGIQIVYNRVEHSIEKKKMNAEHAIAWKNGILLFDKDNYLEVKKKLERWYGVNIKTLGIPPADFVITGQFGKNESLELALEILRYGRHFKYQIKGKEIEIIFN
jgi:transmembrane sensor